MKSYIQFATLILPVALLLSSCAKEIGFDEGGPRKNYDFVGYLDSSTKTDLDGGGHTIWKAGDQVYFYTQGTEQAQTRTVATDGARAEFGAVEAERYVSAVYGTTATQWGTNGFILSQVVKSSQDGTFGDAHVSVAHTTNLGGGSLFFSNLTSMLRFTIQRTDVAYVRVESRSRAQLYGDAQVIFDKNNQPSATWNSTGGSSIKVSTKNGNGVYYVSLLPGEYKDGFEFRCYNASGKRVGAAISRKTLSLQRNRILDLGVLEDYFAPEPDDLGNVIGTNETANCYIAPAINKEYKFVALYEGNSRIPLGIDGPYRAEVLWETYGTSENPVAGTVVSDVSYSDGYVYLTALRNGSALVCLRDEEGNILWSWHIWVWDGYDIMEASQPYYNNAGYLMDRNLGASSAIIGEAGARGLMYQWGRKDPFLGATSAAVSADDIKEKHTLIASSYVTGTVEYSIEHPMTYIYSSNQNPGDWLAAYTDNTLWNEDAKTIYDPCPPGWRMPESDFWTKAFKGSAGGQIEFTKAFDMSNYGINFAGANDGHNMGQGPSIWYPATGYRDGSSASNSIQGIQFQSFLWTAGTRAGYGVNLAILGMNNEVKSSTTSKRACGLSVRCKLDYTPPVIEATGISLDRSSANMMIHESAQLTAVVMPANAASTAVHWETSDSAVATVSSDGLVTGAGAGVCTIRAYASYANGTKNPYIYDSCVVSVAAQGGGAESGLYLGIIGFNDELYKMDIERLDATSKSSFDSFINSLTTKNGTLLYYSVDQALRTLQRAQYPDDLYNVSLVTFTDGLDMGSAMLIDNYSTDEECLESLHGRLSASRVSGLPITAYSVGLRGNDVNTSQQVEMFRMNLKKLAYPESNAYEEPDMSSVNARFQEIAEKISQTTSTTKYNFEITIPGKASGTVWRFTLDGASSAESSRMYIEGTFNLSTRALTNVSYHGLSCSSGSTIQGTVNGIHVTYNFSDIILDGGTLSKDKVWTWWYSSGFWQGNTEFDKDNDVKIDVTHTKQSVVVLLDLDCSKSLDNQFSTLKSYAKSFVKTLYNASLDPYAVTGITLDKSTMTLYVGNSSTLTATISPSTAAEKSVQWSSSNPSVATVDSNGKVTGVKAGTATITATTVDGGYTATCYVTVKKIDTNGRDYVDLGLPSGLKWATMNVGATKPEEHGDYFAWGETEPKEEYSWLNYKFELGTNYNGPFSKYVTNSNYGTVDNKTVLDPEDDAAHVNWGGSWRMPTDAEWTELRTKCTWTLTTENGVNGRKVTGPNGKSIFLSAAGDRDGTGLYDAGSRGRYWSSSLYTDGPGYAYGVDVNSDNVYWHIGYLFLGYSIRAVTE